MRIALLGYGRMGKSIEKIALKRQHSITLKITESTDNFDFSNTDVAIDFSIPSAAFTNIKKAIDAGIPVVSGTTGWLESYQELIDYCEMKNGSFLYASNFSLGVNIFFEINKKLGSMISHIDGYQAKIEEIHHIKKLDAPSGTAITLAEQIIATTQYNTWTLKHPEENSIPIMSKRITDTPGTHNVSYTSDIDTISIRHTAHSREGFALGAVIAAEWLKDKTGVFSMADVLQINS